MDQTIAHQVSLSMAFSRQKYWSGLPSPLPGDLPDTGIKPTSLMSPALAGGFFTTSAPGEHQRCLQSTVKSYTGIVIYNCDKCNDELKFSILNVIKSLKGLIEASLKRKLSHGAKIRQIIVLNKGLYGSRVYTILITSFIIISKTKTELHISNL